MVKSMEFIPKGIVKIISKQPITAYRMSEGVDELLRAYPDEITHRMAYSMYMLGYIEGKRAERARRKAVRHE